MSIQILMANTLAGLENKIGHALNEGWDLAGHITQDMKTYMFFILVMKQ